MVKSAKADTDPEMSATSMISGLAGRGLRYAKSTGTPPLARDFLTVRRKSSVARCRCRRLCASRAASFLASGRTVCLIPASWAREALRNSTSSGSGRRSVTATASAPRSAISRRRISASTSARAASTRASWSASASWRPRSLRPSDSADSRSRCRRASRSSLVSVL